MLAYEPSELFVTALAERRSPNSRRCSRRRARCWRSSRRTSATGRRSAAALPPAWQARDAPPRDPHGAIRDFVLGASLLDGRGRLLTFGGTVIKNVAGYDAARMLAGSLGILGVVTEASIKVLPRPAAEATLRFELGEEEALATTQ